MGAGFWKQLRDLEAVLRAQGVDLQQIVPAAAEPESPISPSRKGSDASSLEYDDPKDLICMLDEEAKSIGTFATHFLTAQLIPEAELSLDQLIQQLQNSLVPGAVWTSVEADITTNRVCIRAKCVPSMDT